MTSEPGDGKSETEGKPSGAAASDPEDNLLADDPEDEGGSADEGVKVNLFTDDTADDLPGPVVQNSSADNTGRTAPEVEVSEAEADMSGDLADGTSGDPERAASEASADEEPSDLNPDAEASGPEEDAPEATEVAEAADPKEDEANGNGDETPEAAKDAPEIADAPDNGSDHAEPPSDPDPDPSPAEAAADTPDAKTAESAPEARNADEEADGDEENSGTGDAEPDPVAMDAGDGADTAAETPLADGDAGSDTASATEETAEGLSRDSFWDAQPEADTAEDAASSGPAPSGSDQPKEDGRQPDQEAETEDDPEPVLVTRAPDAEGQGMFDPAPPAGRSAPNPLLAPGLAGGGIRQEEEPDEEEEADTYYEEEDAEEFHQSTFLRKLGVGAGLLVVGALAGLWIGPKIAPGLPAGLGPVRDFLMPGQSQAQAEIETLRTDLNQAIATLPRPRTESQIAAIVAGSVAANRTEYEDRIATLEARVEELIDLGSRADATGFEPRIAALENRVGGLAAQLSVLNENLLTFESDGSISDEALAQMTGFTANVEAVRAEVAGLVEQIATLEEDITEVRASAERRVQDAESEIAAAQEQARNAEAAAETRAALALIDAAFESGQPFAEALARLEPYAEIPAPLTAIADSGVATPGALEAGFTDAAYDAIRASIQAEADDSVLGRMEAFVSAQVANRSLSPQEGDSTDAILSRAEDALRRENMGEAAAEIAALPEAAKAAMGDWAERLQARVNAEAALAGLRGDLETAREG